MNRNYTLVRSFLYKVYISVESVCLLSIYSVRKLQKKISIILKN